MPVDEVLHVSEGEVLEVFGVGIGAQWVVGAVEQFVVEVAGQVVGLLEVGLQLCGTAAEIGIEELGGDHRGLEHLGDEREELVGKTAHEVEGEVGGAGVRHAFHHDSAEVEEFGHLCGGELRGGFAKELVGSVGLAFAGLVGAAGFESEVELDDAEGVVAEKEKGVAVGQRVAGGNERGDGWC